MLFNSIQKFQENKSMKKIENFDQSGSYKKNLSFFLFSIWFFFQILKKSNFRHFKACITLP